MKTWIASLLIASVIAVPANSSELAEVLVKRLDGNFVFVPADQFQKCLRLTLTQPEGGITCMEEAGIDKATYKHLAAIQFAEGVDFYDSNGSRMTDVPDDFFTEAGPKEDHDDRQGDSSFVIERSTILSEWYVEIIVKPKYKMRLRCVALDSNENPLRVDDSYVTPPIDKVLISMHGEGNNVSSVSCTRKR